ncbi:MAG TPA: hypothetical protein VLJ80_01240 [Solirubrobacteraceae bacterium]|nr:hypothetical protein [Solirubrobacteraceae bacterium]
MKGQIAIGSLVRAKVASLAAGGSILLCCALMAPAAAQAAFGPESFEAGTCVNNSCTYSSVEANHKEAFTQAAGHPPWGITTFVMKHSGSNVEGASVKRIRVDVPPGLAANPEAPKPKCDKAQFEADPTGCPASSVVGSTEMEAIAEPLGIPLSLPSLSGTVYNLNAPPGLPLDFGIAVEPTGELVSPIRLFLEGHVDWSGDYHEFFVINNVPNEATVNALLPVKAPLKVLKSKLNFNGRAGQGNFLTLPSVCSSTTTSFLELESYAGDITHTATHTPVGVEGCDKVPFSPSTTVEPEAGAGSQPDGPDGATTIVQVPQKVKATEINTSDIQDARVTLPEGLTLNPAAAHGLEACSAAQIGIGTRNPVSCPAGSRVGSVAIETDLPPGTLKGSVFLASPSGAPITDPPYTIYLDAESNVDVSVRLQGTVAPDPTTGRLTVTFSNNPQLPFSELRLTLNGGDHAPLANPLTCGAASTDFFFTPYSGGAPATGSTPFSPSGCPASPPFLLAQSTATSAPNAGAYTSYTFDLARDDANQYLGKVSTTLPAGLVGEIPKVTLCGEPQAQAGTCGTGSQIGTATASVGAGGDPYSFTGPVFLTGPYAGAPYGLSIPIHAAAGPFDLGNVVTHATINVDPHSSRVIVTTTDLPSIFKGVPLRLRKIHVVVDRKPFLFNPTNCGPLSTDTGLSSTLGATQSLSSPFAVSNCSGLPFKPNFSAATGASTNPTQLKANGASLRVNLLQNAHEANIHSVVAELPKSLPSRLTTLQKACPAATYEANPFSCPPGSKVGSATVSTPVLPAPLKGPAYLVSHGGEAFPDLDLLLEGNGVRVILESKTDIKGGITKSTFGSIPDVPVTSFVLDLPQGANSALTAVGTLCTQTLTMPTTITAQSGAVIKQNTPIAVGACTGHGKGKTRLKILSKKIKHNKLVLRVQTFAPGRVSVKNRNLRTTYKKFAKAGKFTVKVPLSRKGVKGQRAHKLKFKARVGFLPKSKAEAISVAFTQVGFRHKKHKHKH